MSDIRINALATTAASTASDDYIAIDGSANGTRKLSAYSPTFGGNLTVSGTGAVNGAASIGALSVATTSETLVTGPLFWSNKHVLLGGLANSTTASGLGISVNQSDNSIYTFALSPSIAYRDIYHQAKTHNWHLSGSATAAMALTSAGNLSLTGNLTVSGTGTSSVAGNVSISSSAANNATLTINNSNATSWGSVLTLSSAGSPFGYFGSNGAIFGSTDLTPTILAGSGLGFGVKVNNSSSASLSINSSGNTTLAGNLTVSGTGTSSMAGRLDIANSVSENTAFQAVNSSASGYGAFIQGGDSTRYCFKVMSQAGALMINTLNTGSSLGGNTLLGTTTDSANGRLQLATHTTSAGGIGFGTDCALFRGGSNTLAFTAGTADVRLDTGGIGNGNARLLTYSGALTITSAGGGNALYLQTGGTTALTLDSSQRCILAGALRLNNAYTAGAPTATGYVTIQDSAGNTYKVLVGT